ncbi:tRNA (cytosine(72)-C(5))-methyltransferase NSUN6 isoform X2 [Bactrocera neohumeralis]|uniref:tRNA (cytosine(72)-C(5))-methyltransferase NSUN6 isoform X1 n=1 Tax=Bactrocera tryoni TaxID=59916 RepID=UPI001A99B1F0|nr:tRNA (cytosine(72)-C(5))-methyltransferase NSUN6 isoform X1 [Bactrocera tryoni]XP_050334984.1 tRNA (cytosine(72)-C(5))-methyltransferase NSUN6 isoform X2 [Bactrocera neohumeralis]
MYPKSPFLRNPLVESQILQRNPSQLEELMSWLCKVPTITTYRVNSLRTTVPAFKQKLQEILHERYTQPPKVYEIPSIPEVLCILPTSFGVDMKQKQSDLQREVVVDSCCGAALLRGAHIYAPGVLAMEAGTKLNEEVLVYADLAGKCKQGTNIRYDSLDKIFLGVGVVRMQRHQIFGPTISSTSESLKGVAVEMIETISGVPTIGDLSCKEALLQNLPSIVCVRVLNPQPGERVLDMCAAPGNKTTHIAELMGDKGEVIALDKVANKISGMLAKITNSALKSIRAYNFDATKAFSAAKEAKDNECLGMPPFAANTFDKILLDAPCSALGNRPLLVGPPNMSQRMLQSYPKVQRKLFSAAVPLLKPNGILVYSTCTVTEEENESVVAWVLEKFPQMRLVPATPHLGGIGLEQTALSNVERQYVQRFGQQPKEFEGVPIDTVGFFIAKFIKEY